MIDLNYTGLTNMINRALTHIAHIHDTLYTLTVRMECPDGAPGVLGVLYSATY